MKKIISFILILIVCFSLCSCDELDQMRSCHAINCGDGTIKFQNHIYKQFDTEFDGYIITGNSRDIYITASDVPVLLSQSSFAKYLPSVNKDETIINDFGTYYIREDKYDYYVNAVKNGIEYTKFYCGEFGSDVYDSMSYLDEDFFLNDNLNDALLSFVKSAIPTKTNEGIFTDNYIWLSAESADGFFRKGKVYQLIKLTDGYCLIDYTDDGCYNRYDSTPEYDGVFSQIFETAKKGEY